MFSKEEIERYNRHIILPEIGLQGQEKLKNAKVLVVGAGGLGCPVLQYLTAAGVGTIGICDFDFVDVSNLQRQLLYENSDIGKAKAIVAAEKLSKINPFAGFQVHYQLLRKENVMEIFKPYDIIVDATDNFPTRFLINDACIILNKPFVFGAIYRFEGQVSVFNYNGGPTYRCLVPEEPSEDEAPSCSQIGVMGVLPGLIGCYQAIEVIKIICTTGKVMSGQILVIDTLNLYHQIIGIQRNEGASNIKELGDYADFCSISKPGIRQLNPFELNDLIQNGKARTIDIRDREKFGRYHIQSNNVPVSDILNNLELIPKNEQVVLLCEMGINSLALIEYLIEHHNFKNLYNLNGGIMAWIKAGLPVIEEIK